MAKITFAATGRSFDVEEGTAFLEFCNENPEAEHDFGCTVGSCGTCRLEVLEGAENVSAPTDEERETVEMCTDVEGARLGCQMVIQGDVTVRQLND